MKPSISLSAGILAGGKSSRMGKNKALLTLENKSFLGRLSKEFSTFDEVLLSVAHKEDYPECSLPIVVDEHHEIGPMEGLRQTLRAAKNEYVFVCAVDMPHMSHKLACYMAEFVCSDYECYVVADEDHIHPLCAIYSKRALPVIEELIAHGNYRLREILKRLPTKYIQLSLSCFSPKIVKNVNTKEEYRALVLPIVFCVSGFKDSGKTGLIIKLINEFIQEDYRVGVIKHDGHDYSMDHEGTDTARFSEAGARMSMIYSATQYSVNYAGEKSLEHMVSLAEAECDVIIIEGAKHSPYPKVELRCGQRATEAVSTDGELLCIATDCMECVQAACPVYDRNDSHAIYIQICRYFGLTEGKMYETD